MQDGLALGVLGDHRLRLLRGEHELLVLRRLPLEDDLRLLVDLQFGGMPQVGLRAERAGDFVDGHLGRATREPKRPLAVVVALGPVDDGDFDAGVARPGLRGDGLEDDAVVVDDVVERVLARVSRADVGRPDQPRARPLRHEVVGLSEPVRHVVRSASDIGVRPA